MVVVYGLVAPVTTVQFAIGRVRLVDSSNVLPFVHVKVIWPLENTGPPANPGAQVCTVSVATVLVTEASPLLTTTV